jgi:hypothetical protein
MISGRGFFFLLVAAVVLTTLYAGIKLTAALRHNIISETDLVSPVDVDTGLYDRRRFGGWIDVDGDCLDTRNEILLLNSLTEVTLDNSGCRVVQGDWFDVYSGSLISDPSEIDIDHIVSLSHAWSGGAALWTEQELIAFANDFDNLIITASGINRSKNDSTPLGWLPPSEEFQCEFVQRFIAISEKYQIIMPPSEGVRLQILRSDLCG